MIEEQFIMSKPHREKAVKIAEKHLIPFSELRNVVFKNDTYYDPLVYLKLYHREKIFGLPFMIYDNLILQISICHDIKFQVKDKELLKMAKQIAKEIDEMFKKNELDVPIKIEKMYAVE